MNKTGSMKRRHFLTAMGTAGLVQMGISSRAYGSESTSKPKSAHELKIGLASYSTRKFTLDQTIEMMKELDIQYVTLKSFHLELNSTTQERKAVAKKLKENGIHLMGGGVIYLKNDEEQILNAFQYARDAGMPVIVGSPDIDALPIVDKMVKEFDIKVAIHNHGPGDSKYPSPLDAYKYVKDYDKRIGLCIDIGHSVRWGDDEIEVIHAVKDRLYDFHIKDTTARNKNGSTIELGRGIINIPGVIKALMDIQFEGHVALEYEKDADNPLPGMRECFGYIRGVIDTLNMS